MNTFTEREPLRLDFREERKLVVVTEDDRYETTTQEMAEACRQSAAYETWKTEFGEFLGDLHEWMHVHADIVESCYLAPGEGGMKAFVTTKGERYRFDFDDALTELELQLHKVYPRCPVEILQMPTASPDALHSFFSPGASFQVYGQPRATSREG